MTLQLVRLCVVDLKCLGVSWPQETEKVIFNTVVGSLQMSLTHKHDSGGKK